MSKPAKDGQLVIVRWLDAHAETGWSDVKDARTRPTSVLSIGWVIKHDKHGLTLAADVDPKGRGRRNDCNRVLVIPQGMIQSIHVVRFE